MTERGNLDRLTESMIGAAIEVHRALGPGLLESAVDRLMVIHQAQLLSYLKLFGCKVGLLIRLFGIFRDALPYLATRRRTELIPSYTWRRAMPIPTEPLINFNVRVLKDGIRRVVKYGRLVSRLSRFSAFSAGSAVNRYDGRAFCISPDKKTFPLPNSEEGT